MNTKSTSLFLAGAMLIATVVPAFAASPDTSPAASAAPAKCAKSSTVKKNKVAVKKSVTKAPVASIKKTK